MSSQENKPLSVIQTKVSYPRELVIGLGRAGLSTGSNGRDSPLLRIREATGKMVLPRVSDGRLLHAPGTVPITHTHTHCVQHTTQKPAGSCVSLTSPKLLGAPHWQTLGEENQTGRNLEAVTWRFPAPEVESKASKGWAELTDSISNLQSFRHNSI